MHVLRRLVRGLRGDRLRSRSKAGTGFPASVERLEERQLLSQFYPMQGHGEREMAGHRGHSEIAILDRGRHDGLVRKAPQFYEFYIGPRRADLNVVAASARLEPGRGLVFRGIMQGKINTTPASSADDSFYVFGINRGSSRAIAPFFMRPGVVFDAVVVVSVTHDQGTTAAVVDFASGTRTVLSPDSVKIMGRQLRVVVDPATLPTPSGGNPLNKYTFNLWPRSSLANPPQPNPDSHPSTVASFIPENAMAPIQVPRGHRS